MTRNHTLALEKFQKCRKHESILKSVDKNNGSTALTNQNSFQRSDSYSGSTILNYYTSKTDTRDSIGKSNSKITGCIRAWMESAGKNANDLGWVSGSAKKNGKTIISETKFSFDATNDVNMNTQITHQHVKDLEILSFWRGFNLLWMNSKEETSPTNCVPLTEKTARRRDAEEDANLCATSTTIKDFRQKRENIPNLRLVPESLLKMIKNHNFFLSTFSA